MNRWSDPPATTVPQLCRRAGTDGCTNTAHTGNLDDQPVADGHTGLCAQHIRHQRALAARHNADRRKHRDLARRYG